VRELVAADTVNTMPEKTLHAFADHGEFHGDTITGTTADSQAVFDALTNSGIDITDTFLALENDGVTKFEKSWVELADTVQNQLNHTH
jgi:transaldolase